MGFLAFFNLCAWKWLLSDFKARGCIAEVQTVLKISISIYVLYWYCHMAYFAIYVICQRWHMTYDIYFISQYGCLRLENRQDLSNAAPGFKVAKKLIPYPKNEKPKSQISFVFFRFFLYKLKSLGGPFRKVRLSSIFFWCLIRPHIMG